MIGDEQVDRTAMPVAVSVNNHVTQSADLAGKIYFEVPFEQKEAAKAAGLRWDNTIRKWYASDTEIAKVFARSAQSEPAAPAQSDRLYFKVPFLQKDRAKAMGMRFDGIRKLWFAPNQALAVDAARIFDRITEVIDGGGGP